MRRVGFPWVTSLVGPSNYKGLGLPDLGGETASTDKEDSTGLRILVLMYSE